MEVLGNGGNVESPGRPPRHPEGVSPGHCPRVVAEGARAVCLDIREAMATVTGPNTDQAAQRVQAARALSSRNQKTPKLKDMAEINDVYLLPETKKSSLTNRASSLSMLLDNTTYPSS